jgi:hypothetical protein
MNARSILRTGLTHGLTTCLTTCAGSLLTAALAAPPAEAGGISIGFAKHGKHGSIGISIGGPVCAPAPPPPRVYRVRYETVVEKVWVEGVCEDVWVEPVYRTTYDGCGRPIQVMVRAGYWTRVRHPGHWEERTRRVPVRAPRWRGGDDDDD